MPHTLFGDLHLDLVWYAPDPSSGNSIEWRYHIAARCCISFNRHHCCRHRGRNEAIPVRALWVGGRGTKDVAGFVSPMSSACFHSGPVTTFETLDRQVGRCRACGSDLAMPMEAFWQKEMFPLWTLPWASDWEHSTAVNCGIGGFLLLLGRAGRWNGA